MSESVEKKINENDIFNAFLSILEDANEIKRKLELSNKDLYNQRLAILNIIEDLDLKKNQIESILRAMSEGLIMINADYSINFINPIAKIMLGIEDIGDKKLFDIVKIDREGVEIPYSEFLINKALASNISFNVNALTSDYYFTNAVGKRYLIAFSIAPLIYDKIKLGIIFTFQDATSEKEIDRIKAEFVSIASHQLRTPLTATKWFMEMLIDGDIGELQPEQLDVIHQAYAANERMIELVNVLLNVSRIEAKRITVDFKVIDALKLISDIKKELSPLLIIKKQELVLDLPKDLPQINTDSKLLVQIFTNLISNANKYSPDGSQIVFKVFKKGNEVLFQISDNGYGIPKAEQKNIFKKFFRASNVLLEHPEGTGLGLYIIKSLVELLGGKIWFESEENKGTTFYILLPINNK